MKRNQLEFTTILNDAFAQYERKIIAYMAKHKAEYEGFAELITPSSWRPRDIYSRIAFAILSANAPFEDTVSALSVVMRKFDDYQPVKAEDLRRFRMVPAKAKYLNRLTRNELPKLLRREGETHHEQRMRLLKVKGLGLAKASFAVALLDPLRADVACIDTWMQKVFLGHTGFKSLGRLDYLTVESKVRTYAQVFGVSTFLAQWMIWDHARGGKPNAHAIFPGAHKG